MLAFDFHAYASFGLATHAWFVVLKVLENVF